MYTRSMEPPRIGNGLPFVDELAMFVNSERVVYAGLLRRATLRRVGAISFYFAPGLPFELRLDNGPQTLRKFVAIAPNVPHAIQTGDGVVGTLLLEPETVDPQDLDDLLEQAVVNPDILHDRFKNAYDTFLDQDRSGAVIDTATIDRLFLGKWLRARRLDSRIEAVIKEIVGNPWERISAESCARNAGISFTHFIHLFKKDAGVPFRAFCAWKRARALLPHVQSKKNLTELALDAGYPDSTHFSHSIRRIYGLTPSEILRGSRRLKLRGGEAH